MARRGVSTGALSRPDGSSQVRCAPVILPVRSVTAVQRRPDLGRGVGIGPVITPRMKSQSADFLQGRDAAFAQIHLGDRARNRL
jgi:hypothetical protein